MDPSDPTQGELRAPATTSSTNIPSGTNGEQHSHREPRQDPRGRLSHVLAADPAPSPPPPPNTNLNPYPSKTRTPVPASALANTMPRVKQEPRHQEDKEDSGIPPPPPPGGTTMKSDLPIYTATTTTTRRNANGSVSSVYSGNKIRHLKKEDGVPLWRADIQYDFLKAVFEDSTPVFHKMSDGPSGEAKYCFADIYLDAMAKSSKCSKILKDKLLTERPAALNMAMVCLLVNVGRMNTTLNCKWIFRSSSSRYIYHSH
jgi:Ino eighty subunit 1